MRLLHISDLHAGKRLYDKVSRNEDLVYALEQVESICKENRVEVLLISGDIFDKRNPDNLSEDLVLDFLTKMSAMGVHVVLIAGNHDSYDHIKKYKHLRRLGRVHAFDRPHKDIKNSIFEYEDLRVACLPYPDERVITHFSEDTVRSYAEKVSLYMKALAKEVEKARYRVLLAHLMLDCAQVAGSEYNTSPSYMIKAQSVPEEFTYVALGHVHRHQKVEGAVPKTYYAGSLYQIDFSEEGSDKFVNLVVLEDGMAKVEPIRLDLKRKLLKVELRADGNLEQELDKLSSRKDLLIKVVFYMRLSDHRHHMLKEKVQRVLGENLVRLDVELLQEGKETSLENLRQSLNIVDLYKEYCRTERGGEPSQNLVELFEKLTERASHETAQA
ncbi:MAG: exonuclease SbcCD subunit D [Aquificota bacterium]|nr:MAG: exonuclease SbcCD subunit D [Aquificota bacterium]